VKTCREALEELEQMLPFVESTHINNLQGQVNAFMATPSEELVSPLEVELGSVLETVQTYQRLKQREQQTIRDESKATETRRKTEIAK